MKRSFIDIMGDMDVSLSSFYSFSESLRIIAEAGAEIAGSFRSCIIIKNIEDELIVEAGKGAHGIGEKITGDSEKFLRKVMREHQQLLIKNPASHSSTPHLKDIANTYGVTDAFLFLCY